MSIVLCSIPCPASITTKIDSYKGSQELVLALLLMLPSSAGHYNALCWQVQSWCSQGVHITWIGRFYLKLLHEMSVIYVFSIPEVEICSSGEVVEVIVLIPQLLSISPTASWHHVHVEADNSLCAGLPRSTITHSKSIVWPCNLWSMKAYPAVSTRILLTDLPWQVMLNFTLES